MGQSSQRMLARVLTVPGNTTDAGTHYITTYLFSCPTSSSLMCWQFLRSIQQTRLGCLLCAGLSMRTIVESWLGECVKGSSVPSSGPIALPANLRDDTEQGTLAWARFSAVSCLRECFSLQGGRTAAEALPPTAMIEARPAEQRRKT